jgi:hypothetical protein
MLFNLSPYFFRSYDFALFSGMIGTVFSIFITLEFGSFYSLFWSNDSLFIESYLETTLSSNKLLSSLPFIKFYSNALINKSKILTKNKALAGIYKWTHISTGRKYIGSSYNLSQRFSQYFSFKKKLFF